MKTPPPCSDLEFPEETVKWAERMKDRVIEAALFYKWFDEDGFDEEAITKPEEIDKKLKERFSSEAKFKAAANEMLEDKVRIAEAIMSTLQHKYGFSEALEKGVFYPLPHEVSETSCGSQMLVNYVVAKACGLNPSIVELDGFRKFTDDWRAGHAILEIDVGDEKPWALCNTMGFLGPIEWDVDNKKVKFRRFKRKNKKDIKKNKPEDVFYQFSLAYRFSEPEYLERVAFLRSDEGAANMLVGGQRIGYFPVDKWKSKEPIRAPLYIRYDPDDKTLVTQVHFDRPLIKSRGLELQVKLNEKGRVDSEDIFGYYFGQSGFGEFLDEFVMMWMPIATAKDLVKSAKRLFVDEQVKFEDDVFKAYFHGEEHAFDKAVDDSIAKLKDMGVYDQALRFIIPEALYQHQRMTKERTYLVSQEERDRAYQIVDEEFGREIIKTKKRLVQIRRAEKRRARIYTASSGRQVIRHGRYVTVLDPRSLPSEDLQRYQNIQDGSELTKIQIEKGGIFIEEAADRVMFGHYFLRDIKSMADLNTYASNTFGDNLENACRAAYGRMFAEFLGMLSYSLDKLECKKYRNNLLKIIKKHKP